MKTYLLNRTIVILSLLGISILLMAGLASRQSEVQPSATIPQLITQMQTQKGLFDEKLADQVRWYLSKSDTAFDVPMTLDDPGFICGPLRKSLISQLLDNLKKEVQVTVEEKSGSFIVLSDLGLSYGILKGDYRGIQDVLKERLASVNNNWTSEFAYLLLSLDKMDEKIVANPYAKYQFISALLRIFEKFGDCKAIADIVQSKLYEYPSDWRDKDVLDRVLRKVAESGSEAAYNYYHSSFLANHHIKTYTTPNLSVRGERYNAKNEFSGWPNERVVGKITIENPTQQAGSMRLFGVEECTLLKLNEESVTGNVSIDSNNLVLPVYVGTNVYSYEIRATADWWEFQLVD